MIDRSCAPPMVGAVPAKPSVRRDAVGLRLNVETVENSAFRPRTDTLVLIPGNARWFRQSLTALASMPDNRRPCSRLA